MKIKYGLPNNNIDVTDICKDNFLTNNIITIPGGNTNSLFTDPIPKVKKKIIIEKDDIITEYDENTEVKITINESKTLSITKEVQTTEIDIGFIILRHVNSKIINNYWIECYNCIRKFYPENKIIIIDDNSNKNYLTNLELYKTTIIESEYPKRGELLPYIYYLKNKLFDTAVILHDSVFIQKKIDFNINKYKLIWEFEHHWDKITDETQLINVFNDKDLLDFYQNKKKWKGCFGAMSIITHNYLTFINSKYNLNKLIPFITSRNNRMSFERVISCLLQKEDKRETLLGDIHRYCHWNIKYTNKNNYKHLPLLKVWTGR